MKSRTSFTWLLDEVASSVTPPATTAAVPKPSAAWTISGAQTGESKTMGSPSTDRLAHLENSRERCEFLRTRGLPTVQLQDTLLAGERTLSGISGGRNTSLLLAYAAPPPDRANHASAAQSSGISANT